MNASQRQWSATDVYDLLLRRGVKEPAALVLGDRHVAGVWIPLGTRTVMTGRQVILRSESKGVQVISEGESWEEVMQNLEPSLEYSRR